MKPKTNRFVWIVWILDFVLVAVGFCLYINVDRTPPTITFDGTQTKTYASSMTNRELLQGVHAQDKKDGDVSDSLLVEKIVVSKTGTATITYAALDHSNNVQKVSKTLTVQE